MTTSAPARRGGSQAAGPQICVDIDRHYAYGVYFNRNPGHGYAMRYNLRTGVYQNIRLNDLTGNPLDLPIEDETDSHYFLYCMIDQYDTLHVAGNSHDEADGHHYVTIDNASTTAFTTAASWVHHPTDWDNLAIFQGAYTYGHFDRLSNGQVIWFLSQGEGFTDPVHAPPGYNPAARCGTKGRDYLAFRLTAPGVWTPMIANDPNWPHDGHFLTTYNQSGLRTGQSGDDGTNADGSANRVYMIGICVEARRGTGASGDRIHAAWIWRTQDASGNSSQDPCYGYSDDDGATWHAIDGTLLTMPMQWADRTPAVIDAPGTRYYTFSRGVTLDDNGYPSVVLFKGTFPVGGAEPAGTDIEPGTIYMRVYWDGSAWQHTDYDTQAENLYRMKGKIWRRDRDYTASRGGRRMRFRNIANLSEWFYIGGNVEDGYESQPCPIALREDDTFITLIPDGDTPRVYTWGNGHRGKHS